MIFQEECGELDTEPSYLCDAEFDDETIGKALSSPLFIQNEKNQRTEDKLITLMKKVWCQLSPFSHTRTERPIHELSSCQKRKSSREMENERIRILLVRTEIQKHEFQADSDRRSIQELNGTIESQRREIDHTVAGDEQLRRDQQLLRGLLLEQNRVLREAHMKSSYETEELKRFQGSTFETFARRKLVEDRDRQDSGITE